MCEAEAVGHLLFRKSHRVVLSLKLREGYRAEAVLHLGAHPYHIGLSESCRHCTGRLLMLEEGSGAAGWGGGHKQRNALVGVRSIAQWEQYKWSNTHLGGYTLEGCFILDAR